ncbi:hypothetical protein CATYP_02815 [Corynebacterium atypicum]|uniref:Abasic site processing protein n=1 Tax=Corynebacterium atypicum TaxID=191610 RepID=A0ABN4DBQ4_9CORY|nr:SOS response-associated peptidase [Corynebacterium atypicum]AIG63791.1 hypothetical protein CATYP_02815 [Corynebacterium atypicum]
MCGRLVLFTTDEALLNATGELPGVGAVRAPHATPPARYNLPPTAMVATVRLGPNTTGENPAPHPARLEALLEPARWGLIPQWKKDDSGPVLFNARGETVADKPSFRAAFASRRCVAPMDGYFEWRAKQPYFVHRDDGALLWAAGLWETGLDVLSTTIVTTAARAPIDWLHDRMPVLLTPHAAVNWCTGSAADASALALNGEAETVSHLVTTPVGREVGNVKNDAPELLTPLA